jgi:hypothetical protein
MTYRQIIWLLSNGIMVLTMFGGVWWGLGLTSPFLARFLPWSALGAVGVGMPMLIATVRLRK